jgi:hypothetical protein
LRGAVDLLEQVLARPGRNGRQEEVGPPVRFAADLYRGTAGYYDRYRLPHPEAMITDLVRTAQISGRGRLLDLACGIGQLTFPLRQWFGEV